MIIRLIGDDEPYPGPLWQPTVWDGRYPNLGGDAGDIYINRYREPPLYYVFFGNEDCMPTTREEIKEWVTGGLMRLPMPDLPKSGTGQRNSSSQFKTKSTPLGE